MKRFLLYVPILITLFPSIYAHTLAQPLKAIIIDSCTTLGSQIASNLASQGYQIYLAVNKPDELNDLCEQFPTQIRATSIDITKIAKARNTIDSLVQQLNGIDVIIVCTGICPEEARDNNLKKDGKWKIEKETLDHNVLGCTALIQKGMLHFLTQGYGQIIVLTSLDVNQSNTQCPSYSASMAFLSNYISSLQKLCQENKNSVIITEIRPGPICKDISANASFWHTPIEVIAYDICQAIENGSTLVYSSNKWRIINLIRHYMPEWLYTKLHLPQVHYSR
ncbi:SDR family NAD(P)-dependent oxidoreductase [Vermiphilus pyriformis]|nr:MAG: SDR family NAD(P)-dependent oxidoreductase [Vermiphilus pyriformis]